ncbi:hypothetical protein B0H11DRAFT_1922833 [Mycena galericulata]|nr:hypothetical protein B0H11DRAFT_1922833 [Mycena galericulata]
MSGAPACTRSLTQSLNHTPTLPELGVRISPIPQAPAQCNLELGKIDTVKVKTASRKPKKHREDENMIPQEQQSISIQRFTGQRARRQRELAAQINKLNSSKREIERGNIRSHGQKLRRKLEAARLCLENDPDCDPTKSLIKAINGYESSNPFRRRRDLPTYQERMLGRAEYLRLKAVAKEIDRECKERNESIVP